MSRWFLSLLLACGMNAFAAPESAPMQAAVPLTWAENVSGHLADQAHDVADRTTHLVATAMGFLGVPYRRGGTSAETGFDCSGFVRSIYEQTRGLVLPRRAYDQARHTEKIDRKDLRPGDLVFFNTMRRAFSHVGIYVGDGKFIHSPRSGSRVRVESLSESYWKKRFNGARRVADDNASLADRVSLAPVAR